MLRQFFSFCVYLVFIFVNFLAGKRFTNEQLTACLSYEEWRALQEIIDDLDLKLGAVGWTSTSYRVWIRLKKFRKIGIVEVKKIRGAQRHGCDRISPDFAKFSKATKTDTAYEAQFSRQLMTVFFIYIPIFLHIQTIICIHHYPFLA